MGVHRCLFVDQRGGRSFEHDVARPYLGTPQWSRISNVLAPGEYFDDVRALIVVTSFPLAYLGYSTTTNGSGIADDLMDHWACCTNRAEQIQFMRALRKWKGDAGRELLVVGSDVHIGCHTDIGHEGEAIYKQLFTSPLTNKLPVWLPYTFLKGLLELEEDLTDSYSFGHSSYIRMRNHGLIVFRIPAKAAAVPKVSGGLEIPWAETMQLWGSCHSKALKS